MNDDENTVGEVGSIVTVRWVASVAAVLILVAGCVGQTRSASQLGDLEPCDLVDAAGRSTLGVIDGRTANEGAVRVCWWRREDAAPNEDFEFSVELYDANHFFDSSAPDHQPLPNIGSHRAARRIEADGDCSVSIGAGTDGRWLVVSGVAGGDPAQRCRLADQLAVLIEPKLP